MLNPIVQGRLIFQLDVLEIGSDFLMK